MNRAPWPFPTRRDLREPAREETPLSANEVIQGLREGSIAPGPRACKVVLSEAFVVERRPVEVIDFYARGDRAEGKGGGA